MTNWKALAEEDRRRRQRQREKEIEEKQRKKYYREQAWNPNGCDPEPDFPVEIFEDSYIHPHD